MQLHLDIFHVPFIPAELPDLYVLFPEAKPADRQKCQLFLEVLLWDPSNVKNTLNPLLYSALSTVIN